MLENRKTVIYTGLAILVSMTSNICTFPIHAMEASPQEIASVVEINEPYEVYLNDKEDKQIKEIVNENLQAQSTITESDEKLKVVAKEDDSIYYTYDSKLLKIDKVEKEIGEQEIIIQSTDISDIDKSIIKKNYDNVVFDQEESIEIHKVDNVSPTLKLKKNEFKTTTTDPFNPKQFIKSYKDNIDKDIEVKIENNVDLKQPGDYEVKYSVTDKSGNTTEETLKVNVIKGVNYKKIAQAAKDQIGVLQDCTMLVTNSLKSAGINFHGWPEEYESLGEFTDNPVPGDICIYRGHVALYVGDGKAVHGGYDGRTVLANVYCSNSFIGFIHVQPKSMRHN